jgi:hypothetical protein
MYFYTMSLIYIQVISIEMWYTWTASCSASNQILVVAPLVSIGRGKVPLIPHVSGQRRPFSAFHGLHRNPCKNVHNHGLVKYFR